MGKKKLNLQKIRVSKLDNLYNIIGGTGAEGPRDYTGNNGQNTGCNTAGNTCNTVAQSRGCGRGDDGKKEVGGNA